MFPASNEAYTSLVSTPAAIAFWISPFN